MSTEPVPFFQVEDLGGAAIIVVHAESLSNEQRDALYDFADKLKDVPKPYHVIIDLSPNSMINSRAIAVLIHLQKRVKDAGATIRFCGILPQVRKLLDITRTSALFQIDNTRKDSLSALGLKAPAN